LDFDFPSFYLIFIPLNRAGEEVTCVGFHAASVAWLVKDNGMRYIGAFVGCSIIIPFA